MNKRLWKIGQQFPVDNKFQAVLKMAYLHSLQHEEADVSDNNKMCRKCLIPWTDGYFSVAVVPKCNRSRKHIEKLESKRKLTKQQQSLVKYLKTRVGRIAKYTCQICSYKTRVPLDAKVKWAERIEPVPVSKDIEFKASYDKWVEETQRKKKRHGKSNAGLKIPPKSNNNTGNAIRSQGNTPSGPRNTSTHFKPTDFKLIQQLLQSSVSSNADNKAKKSKTNQPVGRLRLGRS
ncbi:uncharacterized protein LOC128714999 [Anopheles marshallii]|uniref:uncharacterized protein LOC128714999 n=1 Tax=Anopheles marshallii TaxID=1521116 RepID=UPI00237AC501|nr:uncharacterized protein LOC128714999 [Anopheles marshallii]